MLSHFGLGSRAFLYERYDCDVQGLVAVRRGEAAAGVLAPVPGASWGLAMSLAGNPHYCQADPYLGAAHAVCEATRNVVAVGAQPWALTDCLNFGSALDPEVMADLEASIQGLADAARALATDDTDHPLPFVSGNVSLYNQDEAGHAIPPSPIVGCLGRLSHLSRVVTPGFKRGGNVLLYLGPPRGDTSGSEFSRRILGEKSGEGLPALELSNERARQWAVRSWVQSGWLAAVQPVGQGGLWSSLSSMGFRSHARFGAVVEWPSSATAEEDENHIWWSEEPGFLLEVHPDTAPRILREGAAESLGLIPIGQVCEEPFLISRRPGREHWRADLQMLEERWRRSLEEVWHLGEEPLGVTR